MKKIHILYTVLLSLVAFIRPADVMADNTTGSNSLFHVVPNGISTGGKAQNFTLYNNDDSKDGEEPKFAFDGGTNSKWTSVSTADHPAILHFYSEKPVHVYGYTITAAQDVSTYGNEGRTPKVWKLYAKYSETDINNETKPALTNNAPEGWTLIDEWSFAPGVQNTDYAEGNFNFNTIPTTAYNRFIWICTENNGGVVANSWTGPSNWTTDKTSGTRIISLYDFDLKCVERFEDATVHTNTQPITLSGSCQLNYYREFSNTNWQQLYVPFDITITSQLKQNYDIADIYMVSTANSINEGYLDYEQDVVVVRSLDVSEVAHANTPYFIRAKQNAPNNLVTTVTSGFLRVFDFKGYNVTCATSVADYTFTGNYIKGYRPESPIIQSGESWYAMSGGELKKAGSTATLKAQRWYVKKSPKEYGVQSGAPQSAKSDMRILVLGEDSEATAIVNAHLEAQKATNATIYSLSGTSFGTDRTSLPAGIYIQGGKKFIVK